MKFSRKLKIHTNSDFTKILRNKKTQNERATTGVAPTIKISATYLSLFFQKNAFNHPRIGVIIAKKNIKNACERNRLKRIAKESFRLNQKHLDAFDIILMVYKNADQLSNAEWRAILEQQLIKLIPSVQIC